MNRSQYNKFKFASVQIAKNRVVIPPMASQTADGQGLATAKTFDHHQRLARANAGIVFVEYSYMHPSRKGEKNQLGADSDAPFRVCPKLPLY